MATCRLCDKEKPLIRAHIFPDWGYRHLKQGDGHFFQLTSVTKSRKLQSGYQDSNILCRDCDGDIIGKYDTYASRFFAQDFSPTLTIYSEAGRKEARVYQIKDFDYPKLFIFIVSLFWRASITNQPAFSQIRLGRYEDLAKEIILSGKPMYEDLFEIAVFVAQPPSKGEKFEKSIVHPFPSRFGQVNCYRFVFAGFDFVFKVDKRKSKLHVPDISINPKGFMIIHTPFEGSTMGKYVTAFKKELNNQRRVHW
jgi:hypothetical protein